MEISHRPCIKPLVSRFAGINVGLPETARQRIGLTFQVRLSALAREQGLSTFSADDFKLAGPYLNRYIGTAEDLIAAGVIQPHHLPGKVLRHVLQGVKQSPGRRLGWDARYLKVERMGKLFAANIGGAQGRAGTQAGEEPTRNAAAA